MSYDSGSNYKYPEQNKKPSAEEMLPIASTALQTEIKDNKEYEKYCKQLETHLEQLRKENEKLKSDLKIMQELDAEHDKEWDASILKDAKITDLCNVNEKYRQALEKIHGMTNHFSPVNHIAGNALDNIVK